MGADRLIAGTACSLASRGVPPRRLGCRSAPRRRHTKEAIIACPFVPVLSLEMPSNPCQNSVIASCLDAAGKPMTRHNQPKNKDLRRQIERLQVFKCPISNKNSRHMWSLPITALTPAALSASTSRLWALSTIKIPISERPLDPSCDRYLEGSERRHIPRFGGHTAAAVPDCRIRDLAACTYPRQCNRAVGWRVLEGGPDIH